MQTISLRRNVDRPHALVLRTVETTMADEAGERAALIYRHILGPTLWRHSRTLAQARLLPRLVSLAATMTISEFKDRVASVVVYDAPWDTSLVWADAQTDLADVDEADRARVVIEILVQLLDEGLIEYFAVSSFVDAEYEKDPAADELLSATELRERLSRPDSLLRMRATEKARQRYAAP